MERYEKIKRKEWEGKKNNKYNHNIFTFDTESTSIDYGESEKYGVCYIWQLSINDKVYYGRYLEEFKKVLDMFCESNEEQIFVIYVQNLGHDFQFLRNVLKFSNVFAREKREVLRCNYKNIEFRDLYALTGLKLEDLAIVNNLNIQKTKELDYNKMRHNETPLTEEELHYCECDCLVMYEYIKKMLEIYKTFNNMPLTFTGITRKELKNYIYENYRKSKYFSILDWYKYTSKMLPTPEQFKALMNCYAGGYVHSNPIYTNKLMKNVKSVDFSSSYPYCLVSEKYPQGLFWKDFNTFKISDIDFENRAYILKIKFENIRSNGFMNIISLNKIDIYNSHGLIVDNGRIDTARELVTTVNEIDLQNILNYYDYDSVEILEARSCRKDYLPKVFIEFIKEVYQKKQQLKPYKKEKPFEYSMAKKSLNSLYGMCCTNYIHDNIDYNGEWEKKAIEENEIDEQVVEIKNKKETLLPISWGVWCSSYGRKNILDCIKSFDDFNVVYVDTDSIKYIDDGTNRIDEIIIDYNKKCREKIKTACTKIGISEKGFELLGEFDKEPEAEEFKTLGAKKYCYKVNGEIILSLSGVNKEKGAKAIKNVDDFEPNMYFEPEQCGKLGKFYNDNQGKITIIDYEGNTKEINDKYSVCLFPVGYMLDITGEYSEYVKDHAQSEILKNYIR